jgi:hypothetical protein
MRVSYAHGAMAADDQLCPNCGRFSAAGVGACECGFRFQSEVSRPPPSAYAAYPRQQVNAAADGESGKEGLAIAGMIFGIVSIVSVCVFTPLGLLGGIAGIILSCLGMKSRNRGMAIAGLVCSILALLLVVLAVVGFIALMNISNHSMVR